MKTFIEWYQKYTKDVDDMDLSIETIENQFKIYFDNILSGGKHSGYCTKESQPCEMCFIEEILHEYYKYTKNCLRKRGC